MKIKILFTLSLLVLGTFLSYGGQDTGPPRNVELGIEYVAADGVILNNNAAEVITLNFGFEQTIEAKTENTHDTKLTLDAEIFEVRLLNPQGYSMAFRCSQDTEDAKTKTKPANRPILSRMWQPPRLSTAAS